MSPIKRTIQIESSAPLPKWALTEAKLDRINQTWPDHNRYNGGSIEPSVCHFIARLGPTECCFHRTKLDSIQSDIPLFINRCVAQMAQTHK